MELLYRNACTETTSNKYLTSQLQLMHAGSRPTKPLAGIVVCLLTLAMFAAVPPAAHAQSALPFEVSNPNHKKWPAEEAGRIYSSACDLLASSIRPEKPPQLRPRFRLVLGAPNDEFLRTEQTVEIRLKSWNPGKFAAAVAVAATRELLPADNLNKIVRQTLSLAHATVSVSELRGNP